MISATSSCLFNSKSASGQEATDISQISDIVVAQNASQRRCDKDEAQRTRGQRTRRTQEAIAADGNPITRRWRLTRLATEVDAMHPTGKSRRIRFTTEQIDIKHAHIEAGAIDRIRLARRVIVGDVTVAVFGDPRIGAVLDCSK